PALSFPGWRTKVRVVVCTVVHHPADARIFYRQIRGLLGAGHAVVYLAPHDEAEHGTVRDQSQDQPQDQGERSVAASNSAPGPDDRPTNAHDSRRPAPVPVPPGGAGGRGALTTVTIPRAVGRRRLGALRAARAAMAAQVADADLLLVPDPELLLVPPPRRHRPPTVWDVHEDTAAALTTKSWLPAFLRSIAA